MSEERVRATILIDGMAVKLYSIEEALVMMKELVHSGDDQPSFTIDFADEIVSKSLPIEKVYPQFTRELQQQRKRRKRETGPRKFGGSGRFDHRIGQVLLAIASSGTDGCTSGDITKTWGSPKSDVTARGAAIVLRTVRARLAEFDLVDVFKKDGVSEGRTSGGNHTTQARYVASREMGTALALFVSQPAKERFEAIFEHGRGVPPANGGAA